MMLLYTQFIHLCYCYLILLICLPNCYLIVLYSLLLKKGVILEKCLSCSLIVKLGFKLQADFKKKFKLCKLFKSAHLDKNKNSLKMLVKEF